MIGKKAGKKPFLLFGGHVSSKQLTQFTQQFSILLDAGLPVVRSLKILSNQMRPGLLKVVTEQVADDVAGVAPGAQDGVQVVPLPLAGGQLGGHQLGVAQDDLEAVVEVVGDTGGESSHRLHLPGMLETLG